MAYEQTGDYSKAIETYKRAIELAPQFAYLPYNLGLVYQRLNRRKDAEKAYREAIVKAEALVEGPRERFLAHATNALGYLKESTGRRGEAEELYRAALSHSPNLVSRHNLAALLAGSSAVASPEQAREAFALWRANLSENPDYLPSQISLAGALARQGQTAEAVQQYEQVVQIQPGYVAARLALAELQEQQGNLDEARKQLDEAQTRQPENFVIHERIGDLESARGRAQEASAAYQSALQHAPDKKAKKRIRKKLR